MILCSIRYRKSFTANPLYACTSKMPFSLQHFLTAFVVVLLLLLLFNRCLFSELGGTNKWFSVSALITSVNTNSEEQLYTTEGHCSVVATGQQTNERALRAHKASNTKHHMKPALTRLDSLHGIQRCTRRFHGKQQKAQ